MDDGEDDIVISRLLVDPASIRITAVGDPERRCGQRLRIARSSASGRLRLSADLASG